MSATQAEQSGGPLYLYAIVPSDAHGEATISGVNGFTDRITMIKGNSFSAVVGGSPGGGLKGRSRDELGRLLVAHQAVVEQLMSAGPVLPVKFGTQAPDEIRVQKALEQGHRLFQTAFIELESCTQFVIVVTWDLDAVFADIAAQEPIARLKVRLAANEGATPAERAAFGKLVKDALEERRAAVASSLLNGLRAVAIDLIINPVTADRTVLDVALLVKTNAGAAVERCLEMLDAEHTGRLRFCCIGPMPPASFATVLIDFLEPDEIERASRILHVEGGVGIEDVRSAYHRLARTIHPDATGGSGAEMAALSEAYKIMLRHARARENEPSYGAALPDTPAVLVSIERQESASGSGSITQSSGGSHVRH
ncbi:MAG: GvpL/GvpF family gas vesicle protein [Xanthobacteraceae bacterium]|nr:GvpL/GvpF family gas vesicle protein [Xanthobacteraceae bacterium]